MQSDEMLPLVAANLASLNEITAEIAQALAENGMAEQRWADVVRNSMREHCWSLGFEFQGQHEPGSDGGEWKDPHRYTDTVRVTGDRL